MDITYKIYEKDIEFCYENDQYNVIAKKDIKCGTLLMAEHVLVGTREFITTTVFGNRILFDELYPRNTLSFEELLKNKNIEYLKKMANSKTGQNVFYFNNEYYVLGRHVSKFNHSCNYNCVHIPLYSKNLGKNIYIDIYGIYAIKNIKSGDELTLDYINGNIELHDQLKKQINFSCSCDYKDLQKNKKKSEIILNVSSSFKNRDDILIKKIVDNYLHKQICFDITANQELARVGIHNLYGANEGSKPIFSLPLVLPGDDIEDTYDKKMDDVFKAFKKYRNY